MRTNYPTPVKELFAQNTDLTISRAVLAVVLAMPVVFVGWLLVMPAGHSALLWFEDILLFTASCGAAVASLIAAVRYGGTRAGIAWAAIGLGMALMAFGEGAWGFEELILGREVASPAVSDIGYLGFYVPVMFGLLAMPQAPVSGLRRLRLIADTAIAAGAVSLISWHFLIADLIDQSGGLSLESAITVAYPILDLTVIFAAILVVARGGRNLTNASVALLTVGFVCITASDSVYTYLTQIGEYGDSAEWWDTGWLIGYTLITVAAMLAAGRRLNLDTFETSEPRRVPLWQIALFNAPLVPVAGVLFLDVSGSEVRVDVLLLAGFIGLVTLALVREVIVHAEHARLHRQLNEMTHALRAKVTTERMLNIKR